jgi:cell division protein FtsL
VSTGGGVSAVRAPEAPPAPAPRPEPPRRRRRPRLRIVPARAVTTGRRWPLIVVSAMLIGGLLVGIVATQALVNQTSFKLKSTQRSAKVLRQEHAQLQLEVADLSAPARIVAAAIALGLRVPQSQDVEVLQVPVPPGRAAHVRDGRLTPTPGDGSTGDETSGTGR